VTTRTLVCQHCRRTFAGARTPGRPVAYCSDACRVARRSVVRAAERRRERLRAARLATLPLEPEALRWCAGGAA